MARAATRTTTHPGLVPARATADDAGFIALEVVVLVPALLLVLAFMITAGRIAIAHGGVDQAASDAARQASISRTAPQARTSAREAAAATLTQQGLQCASSRVDIDTGGFNAPVGTPAQVSATVTCVVNLSDLALPGIPGTRTVTAHALSPLDTYRERK